MYLILFPMDHKPFEGSSILELPETGGSGITPIYHDPYYKDSQNSVSIFWKLLYVYVYRHTCLYV